MTFSLFFPEESSGQSELGIDGERGDFAGGAGTFDEIVEEGVVGRLDEEEDDDGFRDRNGEIDDRRDLEEDIGRERLCRSRAGRRNLPPFVYPSKIRALI